MGQGPITIVTRAQGANQALVDGRIEPDGYHLEPVEVPVLVQGFRRMVRNLEFDVCEMALTTYLCAREHGVRFTALPIFLVRGLHHKAMVTTDPAISDDPQRLHGQRVGVNRGYTVTTGVWARGILASEYGVDLDSITWIPTSDEHVQSYVPPANVSPPRIDVDLGQLLETDQVVAGVGTARGSGRLQSLVPDPHAAALRALTERGLYPINHLIVVRDDLLASDPLLAPSIFEAFVAAKQPYLEQLRGAPIEGECDATRMLRDVIAATRQDDPLPYGLEPNRAMLELLLDHATDQHILSSRPTLEDVFTRSLLEMTG